MIELLEAYSLQMAHDLFAVYPEWKRYLVIEKQDNENVFTVEVPSPNLTDFGSLGITTKYNNEVTVYFSNYHRHFATLLSSDFEREGAFPMIHQLLNEELVVVQYGYSGVDLIPDGWQGSRLVSSSKIPRSNREHFYSSRMKILSWRGTFDTEFDAPYQKESATIALQAHDC